VPRTHRLDAGPAGTNALTESLLPQPLRPRSIQAQPMVRATHGESRHRPQDQENSTRNMWPILSAFFADRREPTLCFVREGPIQNERPPTSAALHISFKQLETSRTQSPNTGSPTSGFGLDAVKAPSGINPLSETTGFSCNTTSRYRAAMRAL
jgi:hypothetical protein